MLESTTTYQRYSSGRSSNETHHNPSSTGPFSFGMSKLTDTILSFVVDPGIDPSVGPGGTSAPFLADIFGSAHISPYAPFVGGFSHPSSRRNTGIHFHGGVPRHVNIGGTSYIPSHVPSFTVPISSNSFFMAHPPHKPDGPSGWRTSSIHVVPSSVGNFMSGGYVPPYVSVGQPFYPSYNYGYVAP